jgi:hypothetical protein
MAGAYRAPRGPVISLERESTLASRALLRWAPHWTSGVFSFCDGLAPRLGNLHPDRVATAPDRGAFCLDQSLKREFSELTDRETLAATPPAGPTQAQLKTAVDGALAEKIKGLFFELYNGVTTGEPKPNPKAAADRFASNIQSARATYEIAIKAIG